MSAETIIAQCTPVGNGAIALLRISGPNAFSMVSSCALLSLKKNLKDVETHTIWHGWIINKLGEKLDEVLFLAMRAPRTFTGENTIEITCHNNQFLIETLIQEIISCGARSAQPGEFSRCAVENNKIDLLQAEAINEIIKANNQQALKAAFCQVKGSLSHWIATLEKELLRVIVLCEASFEFLEEDINFQPQIKNQLQALLKTISQLKITFSQQKLIRQGVRIALLGSVNTGKSSLFNALIGTKRAIVTPVAGTTRDVIESGVYQKDGTYWTFIDTAGLRKTNNAIEKEGIERSEQEAALADIILLVIDGGKDLTNQEKTIYETFLKMYENKIILILNKNDLSDNNKPKTLLQHQTTIALSAQTGDGIQDLKKIIEQNISNLFLKTDCSFLLTRRQAALLLHFEQELLHAYELLSEKSIAYELIVCHLKNGLSALTELTGKSISEKALDLVFKEFCIGK